MTQLMDKMDKLTKSNEELTKKVDILVEELIGPMIRNVACVIILNILRKYEPPYKRWTKQYSYSANENKLERFVTESNLNISSQLLGMNLDNMVNKNNEKKISENLDEYIEKCIHYFKTFPQLKIDFEVEFFVFENINKFLEYEYIELPPV